MTTNPGEQPPSYSFPGGMAEFGPRGTPAGGPAPKRRTGLIAGVTIGAVAIAGGLVYAGVAGGVGPGQASDPVVGDVLWEVEHSEGLRALEQPLDGAGRWWDEPLTMVGDHVLQRLGADGGDAYEDPSATTLLSRDLDDGSVEWSRDMADVRCDAVPMPSPTSAPRQLACVSRAEDGTGGVAELVDLRTGETDAAWDVPAPASVVHAREDALVVLDLPGAGSGLRWYDLEGGLRWEADLVADGLEADLIFARDDVGPAPYVDYVDVGAQVVVTSTGAGTLVLDDEGWTRREDCRFTGLIGGGFACTTYRETVLERDGDVLWSADGLWPREIPIRPRPEVLIHEDWETGGYSWVDPADGTIAAAPLLATDGRVDVVGTPALPMLTTTGSASGTGDERTLIAFDPATGAERWTAQVPSRWSSSVLVAGSYVLVEREWGSWTALSAETGEEVGPIEVSGTPAASDEALLVTLGNRVSRIALG